MAEYPIKSKWWVRREKPLSPEVIDEIDFEETRRCLINSHNSFVQNHAGYLIALIVGLAAITFSYSVIGKIVLVSLIVGILALMA